MSKQILVLLYGCLALVYLTGLFIPLMENDSAQHASMAMQMILNDDYLHLYRGLKEYLDKPHMHFWLAALSYKIFGISDWAYRIPALLFTMLGAFSTFSLARDFYGKKAGHLASLIFLSAQAIILANHDVRTDAVLTGASIFSIWQLVRYIDHEKIKNAVLGSLALGVAFSTKGQLAIFFIGSALLCYLLYNRRWKVVFNWKVVAGAAAFLLASAPMLYAYYVQFDSMPDKLVNGQTNVSGIKFIFWDQSFNRMTGSGFKSNHTDYFFFFHTMLWAFLPWALITYFGIFDRTRQFIKIRFKYVSGMEFLTVGGFWLTMFIMNMSKSKLPHYMNSLFPVLAVLLAGYLVYLGNKEKIKKINILLYIQYFIMALSSILITFIIFYVFKVNYFLLFCSALLFVLMGYFLVTQKASIHKIVVVTVLLSVFVNFTLNTQFYPNLLKYQGGVNISELIKQENINTDDIFILEDGYSWSMNIYTQRVTPSLNLEEVTENKGKWILVYDRDMEKLKSEHIQWDKSYTVPHYRITMLSADFLNPNTRESILRKVYLLRIS